MPQFEGYVWLMLLAIAAVGIAGVLNIVAQAIKNATNRHDLRCSVAELRRERLSRFHGGDTVVVDVAPEEG